MDEAEWLACDDPEVMLAFLRRQPGGGASRAPGRTAGRKGRLFASACCRGIWHLLTDGCGRWVVAVAERYADRLASQAELRGAYDLTVGGRTAALYADGSLPSPAQWAAVDAALMAVEDYRLVGGAAEAAARAAGIEGGPGAAGAQRRRQAQLIRDIFHPFHPVAFGPAAVPPAVQALAQAAYDERELPTGHLDAVRLAVLADALEEVGADQGLLDHLRSPGPHVRGCFAVDLVLRRE